MAVACLICIFFHMHRMCRCLVVTVQLMANPDGRYFGLWQAQRAGSAESTTVQAIDIDDSDGGNPLQ